MKHETKRNVKADKRKWMKSITSEAEEDAKNQHMQTLYGLTKTLCNESPERSQQFWIKMVA